MDFQHFSVCEKAAPFGGFPALDLHYPTHGEYVN